MAHGRRGEGGGAAGWPAPPRRRRRREAAGSAGAAAPTAGNRARGPRRAPRPPPAGGVPRRQAQEGGEGSPRPQRAAGGGEPREELRPTFAVVAVKRGTRLRAAERRRGDAVPIPPPAPPPSPPSPANAGGLGLPARSLRWHPTPGAAPPAQLFPAGQGRWGPLSPPERSWRFLLTVSSRCSSSSSSSSSARPAGPPHAPRRARLLTRTRQGTKRSTCCSPEPPGDLGARLCRRWMPALGLGRWTGRMRAEGTPSCWRGL